MITVGEVIEELQKLDPNVPAHGLVVDVLGKGRVELIDWDTPLGNVTVKDTMRVIYSTLRDEKLKDDP